MSNSLSADELITQKFKRNFIQFGGARPGNVVKYSGQDAQYIYIDGVSDPESGGIDPGYVPDPRRAGVYRLAFRSITPPDLASATLMMYEKHGAIPRQLQRTGCAFTVYEHSGQCPDLSDVNGWTDYVLIYSSALVTDKDLGTRSARDSDDLIEDGLSITLNDIYPVGPLGFGVEASTQVDREVVDIVYGTDVSCNCTDNTSRIYALVKSSGTGSPGLQTEVVYTLDEAATWSQANIDGMGATEDGLAIDIVGRYLVVIGDDAYYYAELNIKTGAPGTFTKVTTGIVASGTPRDMYVASPREVFMVGDGGYVYKATDITAGVSAISEGDATSENLTRIHGSENVIVAVGENGACIVSRNRGGTWLSVTTAPSSANLTAISVVGPDYWWVGTDTGYAYYTLVGGESSWTSKAFSGSGSGAVRDIVFASEEVGYIAHDTTSPTGRLLSTWTGGEYWTLTSPRILNFPTVDRVNRVAFPDTDISIAANHVALACLAGDGTDGTIALGIAARM